jgi:guanylate kinase
MQKPIIIAIVGESGSGKTTLSLHLEKELGIKAICSYTTRPMREGETDGVEHIFVEDSVAPHPTQTLAYTEFGGYKYWTTHQQFEAHQVTAYVIDEKGLLTLWESSDKFDIMAVKVIRPDNPTDPARLSRDRGRIKIEDKSYDVLITNIGNQEQFLQRATNRITNALNKNYGTQY